MAGCPDVEKRTGGGIAKHRPLHARLGAFQSQVAGQGMDGFQFERVEERLDLDGRVGGQRGREIFQVRNAQEKFEQAGME